MKDIWDESMDSLENVGKKFVDEIVDEIITKGKKEYKEYPKQSYLDEFLSLKCCGDVLNVVNPIGKNAQKEISESMAIIKQLKKFVLKKPMQYNVIDLCAGNALTSILAVHLLPVKWAYAIDKKERKRQWNMVKRFHYHNNDINNSEFLTEFLTDSNFDSEIDKGFYKNAIIISSHPCKLARRITEIYNQTKAAGLIMIPCCEGSLRRKYPEFVQKKLGRYETWCWDLAQDVNGKMVKDNKCLSPKNILVIAER